jgi:hypothetical protein
MLQVDIQKQRTIENDVDFKIQRRWDFLCDLMMGCGRKNPPQPLLDVIFVLSLLLAQSEIAPVS